MSFRNKKSKNKLDMSLPRGTKRLRGRSVKPSTDFRKFKSYHTVNPRLNIRDESASVATRNKGATAIKHIKRELRGSIKKSSLRQRRIILGTFLIISILALLAINYQSSSPDIHIVNEQGIAETSNNINEAMLLNSSQKILNKSFLSHSKLTTNYKQIETELNALYPDVASIKVDANLFSFKPRITVTMSDPVAFYVVNDQKYLVNDKGFVIGKYKLASSALRLPDVIDQARMGDNPVEVREQVLTTDTMKLVGKLVYQLKSHGKAINRIVLPANDSFEVDLYLEGVSYFVKFDIRDSENFDQQIGGFLALSGYIQSHNISPKEYLDVRLSGRGYFK